MQRKRLRVGDICKIVKPFDERGTWADLVGKYVILLGTNGEEWDVASLSCEKDCVCPTRYYELVDKLVDKIARTHNVKLDDLIECGRLLKKSLIFNIRGCSYAWWPSESLEFIRKGKGATLAQIQKHFFNVRQYQLSKVDKMK